MTVQLSTSRRQLSQKLLIVIFALSVVPLSVPGQQMAAKRPLTHKDYDTWRSIQLPQLSRDGKFVAYALEPQDADGEVVVKNLAAGTEWRHPRGRRPPAAPQAEPDDQSANDQSFIDDQQRPAPGGGRGGGAGAASTQLAFTSDGRFAVFQTFPLKAETEAARKAKKRAEEMPKNGMGIMDLTTGQVTKVENVRRLQVPEEGSPYMAYLLEPKPEERPAAKTDAGGAQGAGGGTQGRATGGRGGAGRNANRPEYGSDLVLRNLSDKSERVFNDVIEFTLSKDAKALVYAVSSRKTETNGVYRVAPGSSDSPAALLVGKGKYSRLTWDEKQTEFAFFSDKDDAAAKQPKLKIYRAGAQDAAVAELVSTATAGFRQGYVISDRAGLTFSQDGTKLFFGISRPPEPAPEPDEEGAAPADTEDKVVADLWHWKDDFIQPMQKVRAEQERNRSYRGVFHIKEQKLVQLADETMPEANPTTDGRWAMGGDDRPYRILVGYDTNYSDYYVVNTGDGSRKKVLTKQSGAVTWSPNGKYALYFDSKDWQVISVPDGKVVNLTKDLGVNFWNENNDSPSPPGSYGHGGWTKDDRYVLLYDRYDVWQVAADGSGAKNLTGGRKDKVTFRYVRIDPEERGIDPGQPVLLRAESEWTHDTGFYRARIDGATPQKLMMGEKNYNFVAKAKNADVYLLMEQTFNEFPDLQVSGPNFTDLKKVSDANPQKANLVWGNAELLRFKNTDGVALSAILIKPENFDAKKKYPMMVYIYERLSEGVKRFVNPAPGHSINISYYVSNGYVILEPDIIYAIGFPGQSALKCVLPAIQTVVDQGFIDEKAIGIQGHSWGGYEIAYMVTQTDRFRAAEAGAPVSNMTSAYSGIRWGTGLPRQFQYEHTQSRIGGNLWEYPMRFILNSPVFQADRVKTPLLILANDNDDAVPWYQGIEYYLALRRLGKEVYMFNYNGEPHHINRRPNQKDYTLRMQQFFDHFLKGAPAPEWMQHGIPYIEREKEKERFNAPPEK